MPYDEMLAQRIRAMLADQPDLTEKVMFGGVGFMLRGNMACGVHKYSLIVRVGPERHDEAMQMPYTEVFDLSGRSMRGWVLVTAGGWESEEELWGWVQQGIEFALSLPPK